MATLLDPPKAPNPAKVEEFVEKQLNAARRRVRVLDFFLTGLVLGILSLVFFLAVQLVDRYVETPPGTGWAIVAAYLALAAGFLYLTLFRRSRRQINPYFAARQVEQTVPNSKNSLVTWVDFEEDTRLPGSIRSAIGQKAAKDLKGVDLNRAIENRTIIWLAIAAGVFFLANIIVGFLPPTRTELTLEEPRKGDITVFNNQDVPFQVRVHGRIPGPNDADAVRLRMWYNPDDPDTYEDRPMRVAEGERREFNLVVPAKQVRNGFRYKILAGNTETREYTVTCKIIPEFTGFEVSYEYPAYLKRAPETSNDANLLAPYGTKATLIVTTNREVKHGHIEIEGNPRTIDGQLVEGRPDAIQFNLTLVKEGAYRVWFTTQEGDKNQDPARFRLQVIDPKPIVRTFDLDYEYPKYTRFKPMTVTDVREPQVEALRGTKVVVTAKTTRGVKDAKLEIPGQAPIVGEPVVDQPMWTRFKLPPLDKDGEAKITFTSVTEESPSAPRSIPIRALVDQAPQVQLLDPRAQEDKPQPDLIELPANGTLDLKGLATDDHGVDRLTLRMKVLGAEDRDLVAKPYRGGMSFLRKDDNSWPTRVEYKDFVKLPDLRMEKNPKWRVTPGIEIEYWLEALDNCTEPRPNLGVSPPKRVKVIAPVTEPKKQKEINQKNERLDQEQQKHEKQQDTKNQTDKRDVQQPPPKGAENQERSETPQPGGQQDSKQTGPGDKPPEPGATPEKPPEGTPEHENQTRQVEEAIKNAEKDKKPGDVKPNGAPAEDAKVDPSGTKPEPKQGPMGGPPPAEDRTPKTDPNKDMTGEGTAGTSRPGNVNKEKEDKGDVKDAGTPPPAGTEKQEKGDTKPSYGGASQEAAKNKPERKDTPPMGSDVTKPPEKGAARPEKSDAPEPKGQKNGERTSPGGNKPDKEVTRSDVKKASGEPGQMGDTPPQDVAADKPKEREPAGGTRPPPKKDEAANTGGTRNKPPENDGAGGSPRSAPNKGMDEEMTREGTKSPPGSPPPGQDAKQGELDREFGELEREINSPNPKVDDKKQSDVDRLMRNPETRQQTRRKLEDMAKNGKDELAKKKARDMLNSGEQAANDYDKEKPTPENVQKTAQKLGSNDPKERQAAEQRIKDWEKDQQTKNDLKKETDELKKRDRDAGEKVENATNKAEQARNQSGKPGETPKVDEKQLKDIAKDLNGSDEKAKENAQKQLSKMMNDPKSAKEAQEKLKEMADKEPEGSQEKKDLDNAAKQAGNMAKEMAKKEPTPKPDQKIDPKDLKAAADKLASGDPKAKEEAKEQLKNMMKDPKAAKEAQEKLQEMAKDAKTPEDKKALEDAAKQAEQLAKEMGDKPEPKLNPQDLKDLAKQMANADPKAKQEAREKMQEMMKDPKAREQAMKMMEEMAKNAKNSPEDQKALEEAMKEAAEMARNQPPKLDPKEVADMAKKFKDMDPKAKEELKKQFDEAMKDPKRREELKKLAEEMAKNATPEQKKDFENMMLQLGGPDYQDISKPDPADPRNRLKAAELILDQFKKDPAIQNRLKWTDEQKAEWMKNQEAAIEALRKQAEKGDWRTNRTGRSLAGGGGPEKVDFTPKEGSDALRGNRYAPPAGYADPYKKLTTDQGGKGVEPKK